MPYLLRCVNCNWITVGQFRDTVSREFQQHHKKSHSKLKPRSTVSQITELDLKVFRILSKRPDFWKAFNHKAFRLP